MNATEIILNIYRRLIEKRTADGIPVKLRSKSVVGTVQDDPFDCWIEKEIKSSLPKNFDVYHSGALTTPDLVVRDRNSGLCIGLEIKKLIQNRTGTDSRGLTIDYNSCLPCGSAMLKIGSDTIVVPCYYLFALLNHESTHIVSLILLDGDFINYDFEIHKEAKYANFTEYNHGPYGEGSVRHRRMYTYPNPLNYKIKEFYMRLILIAKRQDLDSICDRSRVTEQIVREDKYGNKFHYYLLDETCEKDTDDLRTLTGIFDACKLRTSKERTVAIPVIPPRKRIIYV